EIALRIRVLIIDCWRKYAFTQGHNGDDELNCARRCDQVPNHALATARRQPVCVVTEDLLYCQRFDFVVDLGARAVSVYISDIRSCQTAVFQSSLDTGDGPTPIRMAVRDTKGVTG